MRRLVFATLLALGWSAGTHAQTYSVEVKPELNGLDIGIEPVSSPAMLVVNLTNRSNQRVRCDLNFQADPQLPYRTFVFIDAGKQGSAVLRATQKWYDVEVDVRCKPDSG